MKKKSLVSCLLVLAIILLLLPSTIQWEQPARADVDEKAVAELLEADTRNPEEAMKAISEQKASKEAASIEAASKEAASKEAASKEAASKEAASKEAASKEAASKEAAASEEAASEEATGETSSEAAPPETLPPETPPPETAPPETPPPETAPPETPPPETAPPETPPTEAAPPETAPPTPPTAYGRTVLIGDSRFGEFKNMGIVPDSQVCAFPGVAGYWVKDDFGWRGQLIAAANTHPQKAIFGAGIDEAGVFDSRIDVAIQEYQAAIDLFLSVSPDTQIYVNAIIPATPAAVAEYPGRARVPEYNAAIQAMCASRGWQFIDANAGFNASYYHPDGVHFNWDWYPTWLKNFQSIVGGI